MTRFLSVLNIGSLHRLPPADSLAIHAVLDYSSNQRTRQCSPNSFRCLNISHRKSLYCAITRILLLTACAQMALINARPDVFKEARGLYFSMSLHLHPYFMYASSEGSSESAHICADSPEPSLQYGKLVHWPMFFFLASLDISNAMEPFLAELPASD